MNPRTTSSEESSDRRPRNERQCRRTRPEPDGEHRIPMEEAIDLARLTFRSENRPRGSEYLKSLRPDRTTDSEETFSVYGRAASSALIRIAGLSARDAAQCAASRPANNPRHRRQLGLAWQHKKSSHRTGPNRPQRKHTTTSAPMRNQQIPGPFSTTHPITKQFWQSQTTLSQGRGAPAPETLSAKKTFRHGNMSKPMPATISRLSIRFTPKCNATERHSYDDQQQDKKNGLIETNVLLHPVCHLTALFGYR